MSVLSLLGPMKKRHSFPAQIVSEGSICDQVLADVVTVATVAGPDREICRLPYQVKKPVAYCLDNHPNRDA